MFKTLPVIIALNFVSQLLDVIYREETLLNVIKSVTRNGRSILLTTVLAVILIYLFSIIGFISFQDDFLMEVEPQNLLENDSHGHSQTLNHSLTGENIAKALTLH